VSREVEKVDRPGAGSNRGLTRLAADQGRRGEEVGDGSSLALGRRKSSGQGVRVAQDQRLAIDGRDLVAQEAESAGARGVGEDEVLDQVTAGSWIAQGGKRQVVKNAVGDDDQTPVADLGQERRDQLTVQLAGFAGQLVAGRAAADQVDEVLDSFRQSHSARQELDLLHRPAFPGDGPGQELVFEKEVGDESRLGIEDLPLQRGDRNGIDTEKGGILGVGQLERRQERFVLAAGGVDPEPELSPFGRVVRERT
jgi:hypothetical protein